MKNQYYLKMMIITLKLAIILISHSIATNLVVCATFGAKEHSDRGPCPNELTVGCAKINTELAEPKLELMKQKKAIKSDPIADLMDEVSVSFTIQL